MKPDSRLKRWSQPVFLAFALVVSIYCVSNLMPLLLHVAMKGFSAADGPLIISYLFIDILTVGILARAIYRLDRQAGRIRNKVDLFE
jgi:hypothetical protein